LHEYKRQHLNVLHVIALYNRLRRAPDAGRPGRTVIFAGKAAPGYYLAKLIIKLIHAVRPASTQIRPWTGACGSPSCRFQCAERQHLYPAAELSEQISTAGMEASGHRQYEIRAHGALTIGTLDGGQHRDPRRRGRRELLPFRLTAPRCRRARARLPAARPLRRGSPLREAIDQLRGAISCRPARPLPAARKQSAGLRSVPGACRFRLLCGVPGPGRRRVSGIPKTGPAVDPEHGADRLLLLGSRHPGVLRANSGMSRRNASISNRRRADAPQEAGRKQFRMWGGVAASANPAPAGGWPLEARSRRAEDPKPSTRLRGSLALDTTFNYLPASSPPAPRTGLSPSTQRRRRLGQTQQCLRETIWPKTFTVFPASYAG